MGAFGVRTPTSGGALAEYMLGDGVGHPRNLSTYAYVFNSPANYVDPDGRQSQPRQARPSPQPVVVGDASRRLPMNPRRIPEEGVIVRGRRWDHPRYQEMGPVSGAPNGQRPALGLVDRSIRLWGVGEIVGRGRIAGLDQSANWMAWWIDPNNRGETVFHGPRVFEIDNSVEATQSAVNVVAAQIRDATRDWGASDERVFSHDERISGGSQLSDNRRHRDVGTSLGTYTVRVVARARRVRGRLRVTWLCSRSA